MRRKAGHVPLRLALVMGTLLLLTWSTLPAGLPRAAGADGPARDCATVPPRAGAPWTPQYPLRRGLHLLPGTPTHDYGPLRPYVVGSWSASPLTVTLPERVDLSAYAAPVGDQGTVGSCAAWAATYTLVGWYLNKQHLASSVGYMAPMYTYRQVNAGADTGAWLMDALLADTKGMLPMRLYPQGNYDWRTAPTRAQAAQASHWRVVGVGGLYVKPLRVGHNARSLPSSSRVQLMAQARFVIEYDLAGGRPGLLEVAVQDTLHRATPRTAWVGRTDAPTGGAPLHALVAVGYDSAGLWVENSWGTGWGLNGYAELSWDYVLDNVLQMVTIDRVQVAPGTQLPPVYRGAPALAATIVKNGQARRDLTTVHMGEEVVWSAKGFRPGEVVALSWDGRYRSYLTALPDGTWSVEWYDHAGPPNAHNLGTRPGVHLFAAVGERGDRAQYRLAMR